MAYKKIYGLSRYDRNETTFDKYCIWNSQKNIFHFGKVCQPVKSKYEHAEKTINWQKTLKSILETSTDPHLNIIKLLLGCQTLTYHNTEQTSQTWQIPAICIDNPESTADCFSRI